MPKRVSFVTAGSLGPVGIVLDQPQPPDRDKTKKKENLRKPEPHAPQPGEQAQNRSKPGGSSLSPHSSPAGESRQ